MPETKSVILQLEAEPPEHCLAHLIIHLRFLISIKNADFVEDHLTNIQLQAKFHFKWFHSNREIYFYGPVLGYLEFPIYTKYYAFCKEPPQDHSPFIKKKLVVFDQ